MQYLDDTQGAQTRGVGLVGTDPIEDMTTTSGKKYISNGKYNRIAASATDSEQGAFKYGRIDYPAIENYLNTDKVLTDAEKNDIWEIIKRLKNLEMQATTSSTEQGTTNGLVRFWKHNKNGKIIKVDKKYVRDVEKEAEYKALVDKLNEKLPGTFEWGGKNRRIIYTAPDNRQILLTSTEDPLFSTRKVVNGLKVRNFAEELLQKYLPELKFGNLEIAGNKGSFNNMIDIENTLGGYRVENTKFPGVFDTHDGYSQLLNTQKKLALKPGWSRIFQGYNFDNGPMRLYIRGTGPNPEPGMTTLSIPNGATPSLKRGNKIINRYVSKIKKRY